VNASTEVVRFAPALGAWVAAGLANDDPPDALVATMVEQAIPTRAAQAIVAAFVRARVDGSAPPYDEVVIGDAVAANVYRPDPPLLAAGPQVVADGRTIDVVMRSTRPTLAVLANVLEPEECEALIAMARPRLRPSTLVDPITGRDVVSTARTSHGMFFLPAENALVERLDARLASVASSPAEHGEGLQVLYYPPGAGSEPHFDYLMTTNAANRASIARSGQRVATIVCYLNEVAAGGETAFPETGVAVVPRRGHAVYFESANGAGDLDRRSLHMSTPTVGCEKWVATKWIRTQPFVSAG
jgi:prolyl 4-hydroxylase